ncbi:MAG: glutamine synthetase family protein, partial [Actinomycetota bacterium]
MATQHQLHTIELAAPDTQGHLRGKRIPAARFLDRVHASGASIADAMFVFDMANDLPDNEFINMDTGYLDCHLVPDNTTGRILGHRPGYGLVFADAKDPSGQPHPLAPRTVLAAQVERCRAAGIEPLMATEMEFYLCNEDWSPIQDHIQYSSLTDMPTLEPVLADMRHALASAGIEVESSNAEYGPGQIEINTGPTDAMTTADNTALYKSIVKQVARQHGLRATFMPKPWTEQSGSGMHVHTSLTVEGANAFASSATGAPNELMQRWTAGLLAAAPALTLLGAPTSNGPKRIRPYTFCPTHAGWGLDNRTVLARCIVEDGSAANRVEYRAAGSDANPYLILAG